MSVEARQRPGSASTGSPGVGALVGLELRRFWWRRLTRYGLLVIAALIAFGMYGTWRSTQPPSPVERAQQEQAYQQALQSYPDQLAACRQAEAETKANSEPGANFSCDQMPKPSPEMFGPPPATFGGLMPEAIQTTAMGASFVLFIIGASFVAAEFGTGSMGTWLTFEPRRLRVGVSKLVGAGLGALAAAAALFAITALGVWVVALLNGAGAPPPDVQPSSIVWGTARGVVMVTAGGVAGATLALIVRSTAAVVGIVVGYAIALEGVIGSTWPTLQQWLVQLNLRAWLEDGVTYYTQECQNSSQNGFACTSVEHALPLSQAWVYLLVLGTALVALALWTFRRRDVG